MSDDLVRELRWYNSNSEASKKMYRAADRIEKLQAALREIVDRAEHRIGHAVSDDVCVIARKALGGKDETIG